MIVEILLDENKTFFFDTDELLSVDCFDVPENEGCERYKIWITFKSRDDFRIETDCESAYRKGKKEIVELWMRHKKQGIRHVVDMKDTSV